MPGLDRTGPAGQGTGTGRKLGKCNPENQSQTNERTADTPPLNRRGRGLGRRMRFGNRPNFQNQESDATRPGRGMGRGRRRKW